MDKYKTVINFRAYGNNNKTMKEGVLIYFKKLIFTDETAGMMMENVANLFDDDYFDNYVCGVDFGNPVVTKQ